MRVRKKEINRIRTRLGSETETRKSLSKWYKRICNSLHGVSVGSTGLSATIAGISLGVMGNSVALIPVVSCYIGLAGIVTLTWFCSNLVIKRIKKHDKLDLLENNVLNVINQLLSMSVIDNDVSDDESKKILNEHQKYIRCRNIKNAFTERTFVEKVKTIEDIDKVFNK